MAIIPLSPAQFSPQAMPSKETQTQLLVRQAAIIIETTSSTCIRVAKSCVMRDPDKGRAHLGTESHRYKSSVCWDTLVLTLIVMIVILLVLGGIELATRNMRTVHLGEFSGSSPVLANEAKPLLGAGPSRTRPDRDFQTHHFSFIGAGHTLTHSPRGSNNSVLQPPETSNFILGVNGDHFVLSPTGSICYPTEPPPAANAQSSDNRGRTLAVSQKVDLVHADDLDQGTSESQTHELSNQQLQGSGTCEDQAQTRHVLLNKPPLDQTNESRSRTAPCTKIRSASLANSLTRLVSPQQATIHILGVGMSWSDIGDGSRSVLPGPPHDMRWLQNVFDNQENFRFKSLLDRAATPEAIHQSLGDMYAAAGENDFLVMYFAGHGAKDDSFELYDPTSPDGSALLNEAILNEWIVELRSNSRNPMRPIYIIFDCCRPSHVKPEDKPNRPQGVNVIWACSPTESAMDMDLKTKEPNKGTDCGLPRSCFLLSLVLAVDDVSENPAAPMIQRFTNRMKELLRVISGSQCFGHRCRLPVPWRCCQCELCSNGRLCTHDKHNGDLPFQVVSVGGIEGNPNLSAVAKYIADRFPLDIKRTVDRVSNNRWVLYFNPYRVSAETRTSSPRNHHRVVNMGLDGTVRNMTIPVDLFRT